MYIDYQTSVYPEVMVGLASFKVMNIYALTYVYTLLLWAIHIHSVYTLVN